MLVLRGIAGLGGAHLVRVSPAGRAASAAPRCHRRRPLLVGSRPSHGAGRQAMGRVPALRGRGHDREGGRGEKAGARRAARRPSKTGGTKRKDSRKPPTRKIHRIRSKSLIAAYSKYLPASSVIMSLDSLSSLRGIRFKETIFANTITHYSSSRDTLSPNSSLTDSPVPLKVCGPLTVFSFVVPAKYEKVSYAEQKANLKSAVEDNPDFQDGLLLSTREKGVLFPVVHVSENGELLSSKLQNGSLGEFALNDNVTVHQAVYQEVRKIVPETELPQVAPFPQLQEKIGYILLGFKSLDKNFSQVMLDTWKDWTGARYIYMYLPDDLGLRRISFYHRQHPDDLNLFKYLVLVECHGITSREKLVQLLDFAQRMRLERLTGYISVYAGEKSNASESPTSPFEMPQLEDFVTTNRKNNDIAEDLFPTNSLGRNSRM